MYDSRTVPRTGVARRAVLAAPIAAASLLAVTTPALADPALPQIPADGAVVGTLRPTFSWTAGSSGVPITRYEVFVETPAGALRAAEAPAGILSAASSVDLPDDGLHRWFVRLTNALGGVASTPIDQRATVLVATPPVAPALVEGPVGPTAVTAPVFSWTGSRSASHWAVADASGSDVQTGDAPAGGGRATLAPLPDGAYVFRVDQRNAAGAAGEAATRAFTVDATAPSPPSPTAAGAGRGRATTPAFSWRSADPGAVATWRVRGARGRVVAGPVDTTLAGVAPKPLPSGAYVFEVRLTDAAGNVGQWGSEPFSIIPAATPASGQSPSGGGRLNLLRRNARALLPAAGARISTTRPVLRWRGGPAGTGLYNLQIFRVGSRERLVKVGSAFPSGRRYALPAGTALTPGACYVWRVWPYRGRGYTPAPLGISDFCVEAKR